MVDDYYLYFEVVVMISAKNFGDSSLFVVTDVYSLCQFFTN